MTSMRKSFSHFEEVSIMIETNYLNEKERKAITRFLQGQDRNGCYTDENSDIEGVERMSYEDAVKYFFGVINSYFYYSITDNIFELSYEEIIQYAKENNFYNKTMDKLNKLVRKTNISDKFYRSLLD
jgi:hypothetical protein